MCMHTHIDYSTLHYITVHYIALYCITLHHIASHCVTSHYIALHCIAYCNIRTVITLHYGTLQYITLHIYHTYVYTHIYNYIYIIHIYLPCLICFLVPNHSIFVSCIHVVAGKTVDLSGAGASYVTPQPNA